MPEQWLYNMYNQLDTRILFEKTERLSTQILVAISHRCLFSATLAEYCSEGRHSKGGASAALNESEASASGRCLAGV